MNKYIIKQLFYIIPNVRDYGDCYYSNYHKQDYLVNIKKLYEYIYTYYFNRYNFEWKDIIPYINIHEYEIFIFYSYSIHSLDLLNELYISIRFTHSFCRIKYDYVNEYGLMVNKTKEKIFIIGNTIGDIINNNLTKCLEFLIIYYPKILYTNINNNLYYSKYVDNYMTNMKLRGITF